MTAGTDEAQAPAQIPATFEDAQAIFAAQLPGYTRRAHQILLAERIEQAIAGGDHLLAQAGTGTGKSFALLIPLILSGKRGIVATFNKALQNQYIGDLIFLATHLGVPFKWAILKGRSNYPCLAKARDIKTPSYAQREVLAAIERDTTPEALLDPDLPLLDRESFPLLPMQDWRDFSMSAEECPGADSCPLSSKCFTERAKARAAKASVVVTNEAYLLQDLKLRQQSDDNVALLGEIDLVIVDEAHTLPDVATSALEDTIGEGTYAVLARDMASYLHDQTADDEPGSSEEELGLLIAEAAARLWDGISALYAAWSYDEKTKQRTTDPMKLSAEQHIIKGSLGPLFIAVNQAIDRAREAVKRTRAWDEATEIKRARLLRRSLNQMDRLTAYGMDPEEKTVRWIEHEEKGDRVRLFLRSAPVSVAPFLKSALFDKFPVIMSSATLSGGVRNGKADFSMLMETIGLTGETAGTYDAGSPFDYSRQAMLYVPGENTPAPNDNLAAWRTWAQTATREMVLASRGGALLLYTSRSAMNEAYEALATDFADAGLTVLIQDGNTPSTQLIQTMKDDGNAVLFGLRTFFEGVDIQGRALRLVVLDKLPFTPPTDVVYAARCDAIGRKYRDKWAWMTRLAVPAMVLVLTQAFGRLIRHADDKGAVAILDNRLTTKRYGRNVLAAMPPAVKTSDARVILEFLRSL